MLGDDLELLWHLRPKAPPRTGVNAVCRPYQPEPPRVTSYLVPKCWKPAYTTWASSPLSTQGPATTGNLSCSPAPDVRHAPNPRTQPSNSSWCPDKAEAHDWPL